jgi:hypothetical protein
MENGEPGRRRNRAVLWLIAGLVAIGMVLPPLWSRAQQPRSSYATYEQARRAGAIGGGLLPRRLPPSATEIHEKHFAGGGHRWVRFRYDPADAPRMLAGLQALPPPQVQRLRIPSPGWAGWWLLDQGVTTSKQGAHLRFYRAEDGWLAVDPRTSTAYFWTE